MVEREIIFGLEKLIRLRSFPFFFSSLTFRVLNKSVDVIAALALELTVQLSFNKEKSSNFEFKFDGSMWFRV